MSYKSLPLFVVLTCSPPYAEQELSIKRPPTGKITDARIDPIGCDSRYSTFSAWNADETTVLVSCLSRGPIFLPENKVAFFKSPSGQRLENADATWDRTDPDKLYAHTRGDELLWMDTKRHKWNLIAKIALPTGHELYQMSSSDDFRTFAFTDKDEHGAFVGYLVWRDGAVIYQEQTSLDETHLDKTGKWLTIRNQPADAVRILDLSTGTITEHTPYSPEWFPGHSDYGAGFVVGHDARGEISFKRLDSSETAWPLWTLPFGHGSHTSLRGPDDVVLVSTYGDSPGKIWLVESGLIAETPTWDGTYLGTTRASLSYSGKKITWTQTENGRRDVWVTAIPSIP